MRPKLKNPKSHTLQRIAGLCFDDLNRVRAYTSTLSRFECHVQDVRQY